MNLIFKYTTKRKLFSCFLLMILTACTNAFTSFLFSKIIQLATQRSGAYLFLLLASIVIYGLFFFLSYFEIRLITQLIFEFNTHVKEAFVHSLLKSDNSKIYSGEELNFVTNDLKLLEQNYLGSFFQIVKLLATFVISFITAMFYDISMAFVFIIFSLIPIFIPKLFESKTKLSSKEWSTANALFVSSFKEMISGLNVIRMFQNQKYFFDKNSLLIENAEQQLQRMNFLTKISSSLINTIGTICFFVPIIIGGILVTNNRLALANLMGLVQISNTIVNPLISGISLISTFHSAEPIIEKLQFYFSTSNKDSVKKNISSTTGNIYFHNLMVFRNEQPIFRPINATIKTGEKVLIRGRSGIGKSTLLHLIMGQDISYQGSLEVERQSNSSEDKLEEIFDLLLVPQEPFLMNASIKENICFDRTFTLEKYQEIIEKTDLIHIEREWGEKPLGENGQFLSGGQKQRVVLARTLIRNPKILLLDECTSALDAEATENIQKIIHSLPQTVLEVAHKVQQEEEQIYDKIIDLL